MTDDDIEMTPTDVAHLAGYFDARGVITIHVLENSDYKINYEIRPDVKVTVPHGEDIIIGKWLAYCDDHHVKHGITETEESYRLSIRHLPSAKRFLDPLMPYLVSSLDDADIFIRGVLPPMMDDEHHTKSGFIDILETAQPLRQRASSQERHTVEEFRQKWAADLTA